MKPGQNSKDSYSSLILVFASALLAGMCCLQLVTMAPLQFRYQVRAFATAEQLQRFRMKQDIGDRGDAAMPNQSSIRSKEQENKRSIQVEKVEVISASDKYSHSMGSSAESKNLTALRIIVLAQERLSIGELQLRLRSMVASQSRPSPDSPTSALLRKLQWEYDSLEHSLRQIVQSRGALQVESNLHPVSKFDALTTYQSNGHELKFASTSRNIEHWTDNLRPCLPADDENALDQIEAHLKSRLTELRSSLEQHQFPKAREDHSNGFQLLLAGPFSCTAVSGTAPGFGMFVVFAIATLAGWATWRWMGPQKQVSNQSFDNMVRALSASGLAYLGDISVPSTRLSDKKHHELRSTSVVWHKVVDVLFWMLIAVIAFRAIEDPLWRNLLLHNPLAALGRLFQGF